VDNDLIELITCCIRNKIEYFSLFQKVVDLKKEKTNSSTAQWKNEKWLQTEIVCFFWKNNIKCIPEFNRYDIYVQNSSNTIIELKERFLGGINQCYWHELLEYILKIQEGSFTDTSFLFISTYDDKFPNCGRSIRFNSDLFCERGEYTVNSDSRIILERVKFILQKDGNYIVSGSLKKKETERLQTVNLNNNIKVKFNSPKIAKNYEKELFIHIWKIFPNNP